MEGMVYLVRHGQYNPYNEGLSEQGFRQAELARDDLVARGLGGKALVFSSDERRAIETAEVIAGGLDTTVAASTKLAWAGLSPTTVDSLDRLIEEVAAEHRTQVQDEAIVIVAHEPLLRIIKNNGAGVANGEIITARADWENSRFDPRMKEYAERKAELGERP